MQEHLIESLRESMLCFAKIDLTSKHTFPSAISDQYNKLISNPEMKSDTSRKNYL